ncbi:hypothetical protein [Amycolatopsis regifaucium]|uniref:Peptidase M23 n=1 Tax=Amycolatopsis regifaucium TaxID=546365 RepID=A0A154M760_9PSEU|nr:hypothetical protein [Amycolatopsis regifaucium]KZB80376.1 hypothetical protein AVL48_12810 [Amycolatopsis regifaucium]OKA05346.1 hypothetical protein ATP06_0226635 [Amycolatopsis regifaucium]SFJ06753.1 hypothetical protein SAMN04489731_11598 [Amycolatopsis regifaucium]
MLSSLTAAYLAFSLVLLPPTESQPDQVDHVALPCAQTGPSADDGDTAKALNQQLGTKMRGYMNPYNTSCARVVVESVRRAGLDDRAAAIAIATVIVESSIANLDGGMGDSVGLFQQRASWGSFAQRTDPVWATGKFLAVMRQFYPNDSWKAAAIGDVAAAVQRPAAKYRHRYGVEAGDAVKIVNELWVQDGKRPPSSKESGGR